MNSERVEVLAAPAANPPTTIRRIVDVCVAAAGLIVLAPLMAVVAVLIRLESSGPVFTRQERIGKGFRPFRIYKFRTIEDAPDTARRMTVSDDPRPTRLGRVLRRTKIDELPQLLNVIKGEMTLVGPRPEVPKYVELFRKDYEELLKVPPGITDLASLEYRDEATVLGQSPDGERAYVDRVLPAKLRLSLEGMRRSSLLFDAGLVGRTVAAILHDAALPRVLALRRLLDGTWADTILKYRRIPIIIFHVGLMTLCNYLALWLRFDGRIPPEDWALFTRTLPLLLLVHGVMFIPFRLYEGLWRYTGIWDLRNIVLGVISSATAFYLLVRGVGESHYPRSALIVGSLLLIFFMGGSRLAWRMYPELRRRRGEKRVLIFGAGDAGEMLVRDMHKNPHYDYEPIGFIDDDPSKLGERIHGVPVLGSRQSLRQIVTAYQPDEVLVAIRHADPATVRAVVAVLEPFKVPIKTLPNLRDIVNGKVTVSQIRNLSVEDLLVRAPVGLDDQRLRELIANKRILVTGAGGSIGSELSRQIASWQPQSLVLYERYENSLYAIVNDLSDRAVPTSIHPVVGDVTDGQRLNDIISTHRPDIIFHAAAHKHVPLMEMNPCEAVKNNVIGTYRVALAAQQHGVERFVLISTDKAVNPSSVMGATKRVAELIQQGMASRANKTRFVTVRFGNVLGSNGSVVPRFLEQIKAGGPVTVTHPEIQRYFMLIPEAVQLVLHAAALGEGGAVYVLEMGEQIRLVDIARNLIRLSGLIPDEDIALKFTGLRPGEKISEQLVAADEIVAPSSVEKILRVRPRTSPEFGWLTLRVAALERLAARGRAVAVIQLLREIVPTFGSVDCTRSAAALKADEASQSISGLPFPDRRHPGHPDRRRTPRGGRRRTDVVLAAQRAIHSQPAR